MADAEPTDGATPNRPLPRLVLARHMLGSVAARFGIGGVITILLFGIAAGMDDIIAERWAYFRADVVEVAGTVSSVDETIRSNRNRRAAARRRGDRSRGRPLERRTLRIDFEFVDATGRRRSAVSYSPDQSWSPGEVVPIEYPRGEPEHARVVGARTTASPHVTAAFLGLLPVGLAVPLFSWWFYARRRRLYREGVVTPGRIYDMAVMPSIVSVTEVAVEVEYEREGTFGGTKRAGGILPKDVPDGAETLDVIYLPNTLMPGQLLDALPGGLRLNQWDEWVIVENQKRAWLAILWPPVVAVVLAVWFVFG